MTVIAAYLYRHGKRVREIGIDEKIDRVEDKSEFVWIGIADPTADELRTLQGHYDLHPLAVEDALKADQLPKIDVYDDQLFVVARTPHLEGETIEYGETAIFVGRHHIISVRHGSTRAHTALREQLEKAPGLLMHGVDYLLHAILDYIVDGYQPLVEQLEEEGLAILLIEQKLDVATSLAERQLVMVGGEIALETTGAELERDTDMQRRFLGVEPVAHA